MKAQLLSTTADTSTTLESSADVASEYLTEAQYCALLHVVPKTAQRQRVSGEGPPFIRMGARRVLYRRADVDAYLAARTFKHRAAEAVSHAA